MDGSRLIFSTLALFVYFAASATPHSIDSNLYWLKIKAANSKERTQVANTGVAIEAIGEGFVEAIGTAEELRQVQRSSRLLSSTPLNAIYSKDFPQEDARFHNYSELVADFKTLSAKYEDIAQIFSLGPSVEGREIWAIKITGSNVDDKPAVVFLGGHHAREHISVETPYLLAEHLLEKYQAQDQEVVRLINSREIYIIPMVNPDGAEYDIASGSYKYWRKNRAPNSRGFGTDLNRNYDFKWGTTGASADPRSDTYRGAAPFSEPESQAIKKFVEAHPNISILVSFHSFSELILYPWGHTDEQIPNQRDLLTYKKMAEAMAQWNGYKPMQSSELYQASGDTTDWTYGVHGIFSFTFELDPRDMFSGGFYPGADKIDVVFQKNLKPALYLIDLANNPYRVLEPVHVHYGLSSALVD